MTRATRSVVANHADDPAFAEIEAAVADAMAAAIAPHNRFHDYATDDAFPLIDGPLLPRRGSRPGTRRGPRR